MCKPAILVRLFVVLFAIGAAGPSVSAQLDLSPAWLAKLDPLLQRRALLVTGESQIIVSAADAASLQLALPIIEQVGGTLGRALPLIDSQVAIVPNPSLPTIASSPFVRHLALDRVTVGALERTGATVRATIARQRFGFDGSGIGIAVIDSGATPWHDDLSERPGGAQRVDRFIDLVKGLETPYDDYGHGTHVAGIIAGHGFDSGGARSGIAPAARLIVLKVLDATGRGRISDVVAALDYVVTHREAFNIRVVNLSVATGVYESYNSDPLTLAARRAVTAGIVVVAVAGNNGHGPDGRTRYAGITAPGNAPWVLTVGASSHMGTVDRADDAMAAFSSRGPAAVDDTAKPDLVAPGVGIESLSDPTSYFFTTKSQYLLNGTVPTAYPPYLSLSGTSMAAPVVSGTVALMLQANPSLTPNAVKAILQYTAQAYAGYDGLTQGTGFLNAEGAIALARFLRSPATAAYPSSREWVARLTWGNHLVGGGRPTADANAWSTDVLWGATDTPEGQKVEWGVMCADEACDRTTGKWAWGHGPSQNVVWGSTCGGVDCSGPWTTDAGRDAVSTDNGDTVVWGTNGYDGDSVVWGTSCADPSCEPVIWNTP